MVPSVEVQSVLGFQVDYLIRCSFSFAFRVNSLDFLSECFSYSSSILERSVLNNYKWRMSACFLKFSSCSRGCPKCYQAIFDLLSTRHDPRSRPCRVNLKFLISMEASTSSFSLKTLWLFCSVLQEPMSFPKLLPLGLLNFLHIYCGYEHYLHVITAKTNILGLKC